MKLITSLLLELAVRIKFLSAYFDIRYQVSSTKHWKQSFKYSFIVCASLLRIKTSQLRSAPEHAHEKLIYIFINIDTDDTDINLQPNLNF